MDMLARNEQLILSSQANMEKRIKFWDEVSKSSLKDTFEQQVAQYIAKNEHLMLTTWVTMHVYEMAIARHMYCTEWAVSILDVVAKNLDSLEKSSLTQTDKERLMSMLSQIKTFKTQMSENQPFIDNFKEATERTKKYLNDNR